MGAVIGIPLFVAAVVTVQFGALWGLIALTVMLIGAAALLIFADWMES